MKQTLLLSLLTLTGSLQSQAAPFPWESLVGEYDFVSCEYGEHPVWQKNLEEVYVTFYRDNSIPMAPDLHIWIRKKVYSPVAVGWSLHSVNGGKYEWRHPGTGMIEKTEVNYTDETGLHGTSRWNYVRETYRDYGQSRMFIDRTPEGLVRYDAAVTTNENPERSERCLLRPRQR